MIKISQIQKKIPKKYFDCTQNLGEIALLHFMCAETVSNSESKQ